MTFKELLLLIVGGVLANNCVLQKFYGVTPFLGAQDDTKKTLRIGLAVAAVTFVSALIVWPVNALVLAPFELGYLQTLVAVAIVLAVVYLAECIARAAKSSFGSYFPLIALNGAVLGVAVDSAVSASFPEALARSLGLGLGFLVAMLLYAGVRSRIYEQDVPKAFRGLPVQLLAAAILSMAVVAFK